MNNTIQNFGGRIRTLRKAKGMTQGELGKKINVDQAYISRLENGTAEGTPLQIAAIAKELGVTVSDILDDKLSAEQKKQLQSSRFDALGDIPIAEGLQDLADDLRLLETLTIQKEEWRALASIQTPKPVNKDGYVQLLITLRAVMHV